jgi:polysaccharide export outer membrane protein
MLYARGSVSRVLVRVCLLLFAAGIIAPYSVFSQQKVETTEETNKRIREFANRFDPVSVPGGDYKIGGGDVLNIEVFDVPQLTREIRVSETGYIALPLLPVRVLAKGLTGPQLEEKLQELLQANGLVSHPQVTVSVKQQSSHPIMVIGAVRQPQVIQATRPMSLVEVLSACGGIADYAGESVLITKDALTEPNHSAGGDGNDDLPIPQTFSVDLMRLLTGSDPKNNVILTGGETVSIPRAGVFYIVGAVNHPGGFVMTTNGSQMTTLVALALASGTTPTAKTTAAIILRKDPATGKNKEITVNLKLVLQRKTEDTMLMANDILYVPDSTGKKALRKAGEMAMTLAGGVALVRATQVP